MRNVITTATLVSDAKMGDEQLSFTAVSTRTYIDAEGRLQRASLLWLVVYGNHDIEDKASLLVKNARVAFSGYFTADYYVKNASEPDRFTGNGPVVWANQDGTVRTAFTVTATRLEMIAENPTGDWKDQGDLTHVVLWGFLGRDAEMRYTPAGQPVSSTSLAQNMVIRKEYADGIKKLQYTTWWRINQWGKGADNALQYWKKGVALIVEGDLSTDVKAGTGAPKIWKDKNGESRATYDLAVASWTFAPSKGNGGSPVQDSDYQAPASAYDEEIPL